jgi:hypothetical protein
MPEEQLAELAELIDEAFVAGERLSRGEIHRHAIAADLPPELMARVDALPEGEYSEDEALEALTQVADLVPEIGSDDTH